MATKIVKNISDQELTVPGIGVVEAGASVEVPTDFHNVNFTEVKQPKATRNQRDISDNE